MLTSVVDKWPKWAKILLTIFGGASVVYRVFLFVDDCIAGKENKNGKALAVAIVLTVLESVASGLASTSWIASLIVELIPLAVCIIDLVTLISKDAFTFLTFKENN